MANVNLFPIDDVVQMAELTGFSIVEIQAAGFTDNNLAGLMGSFYAGTLSGIVQPGQGTRTPEQTFEEELKLLRDPDFFFGSTAEFATRLGKQGVDAAKRALKPLGTLLDLSPLIIVGGITLAILLLARKAK